MGGMAKLPVGALVGTRSRAIRARASNENCKAKTSPIVREKSRRDAQRRIAQEHVPGALPYPKSSPHHPFSEGKRNIFVNPVALAQKIANLCGPT